MQEIKLNKLVEIALKQNENEWHFHLLTPYYLFNDSAVYKVILETKDQKYLASVDHKPSEVLEKLENHFYKRNG
ncbi:MAG: hypothetical protein M3M85_02280 [bacterium]|nr:hypothetical protein [bacterium]